MLLGHVYLYTHTHKMRFNKKVSFIFFTLLGYVNQSQTKQFNKPCSKRRLICVAQQNLGFNKSFQHFVDG